MQIFRAGLAMLLIILVLAACDSDQAGDPQPRLRQSPPPGATVAGCDRAALEQWYESTVFNLRTFRSEARQYVTRDRDQLRTPIERLSTLRASIVSEPVPECQSDLYETMTGIVNQVVDDYLAFYNGEIVQNTLEAQVLAQLNRYDAEILPLLNAIQTDIDRELEGE